MKKLFLLLTMLVVGIVSSWADGLKVSTTESSSAEYQYKIFCRAASTYYLGNTTNATNSGKDYGLFAFYADESGDYTNGYYIYSIFEGKWVTYEALASYSEGKNKILLSSEKPTVPWNIAADDADNKYYDIRPFKTDKSVDDMSWNWHGGPSANTSNTMGFYSYTDANSGWGLIYSGGSVSYFDRKVVALYNRVTNNDEYPAKASSTNLIVSNNTNDNPQYFILLDNGTDSNSGEPIYNIMKAEADGYYLNTGQPYQNTFSNTSRSNYLFLNSSCQYKSYYEGKLKEGHALASSPNFNFLAKNDNYRSLHSKCDGKTLDGWTDNANSNNKIQFYYNAKDSWNGLWAVKVQDYSVWKVIVTGPADGSVTYKGSSLISGATDKQSNNGYYALNTTPSADDFEPTIIDGYCTDISVSLDNNFKEIKVEYTRYNNVEAYLRGQTALDVTPKGLGYPTENARARLKNAIDVFKDKSTTSNLTELITAYTSFFTNVVLPEEKVYTIQSYIKSPSKTTYLKNESGTLTIGTDASETALNNLWIVRKSGNNYVLQSASDPTKYIVYNSFTLAAAGSTWTLSCGTEWPCISMYNSSLGGGRYVACNGSNQFGTAGGSNYYAGDRTQSSGWSTDFKFVESEDYALYKVKIIYPSGNTPTVTYSGTAYSNGADFVASTTLTTSDLTVSTIEGYTSNVSIDGDVIYVNYNVTLNNTYADAWDYNASPWLLLNDVPDALTSGRTYRYNTKKINITGTYNLSVNVKFEYASGGSRIDVAGVDLIDPSSGEVVGCDYHDGFSGTYKDANEYKITNVTPGNYILRYISYSGSVNSNGNITVFVTPYNGFYRIKAGVSNKYITGTPSSYQSFLSLSPDADAGTIIYLNNNKLLNYSKGLYQKDASKQAAAGGAGDDYTIYASANRSTYYTIYSTTFSNYIYDSGNTSGRQCVDRQGSLGGNNTDWQFEEVTSLPLETNSDGYTTFSAPVPVTIPSDCNAFIAKSQGDGVINLEKVTGNVAANTGLIISTKRYDDNELTFNIVESGTDYSDYNLLVANVAANNIDKANNYFFGKYGDNYVFTKISGEGTRTLAGHKAYLDGTKLAGTGARISISWDIDNPTGIDELKNDGIELKDGKYYQKNQVVIVRNGVKYNVAGQIIK